MGLKLKRRFMKGEIKGDLIARSKKAFALTPEEKAGVKRIQKKAFKKLPSKKKIKKLGNRVNFRNLF